MENLETYEPFELDELDLEIITILEEEPQITYSEIGRRIGRSQPAVGTRIHKLEDKGLLRAQMGVDFERVPLILVKVDICAKKTSELLDMANHCPFIVNCLRTTGDYNLCMFVVAKNMEDATNFIDMHIRDTDDIKELKMNVITGFVKPWVKPIDVGTVLFEQQCTHYCFPGFQGCVLQAEKNPEEPEVSAVMNVIPPENAL